MQTVQRASGAVKNRIDKIKTSERMQYWFAIKELTSREIKRKYARSYLGIIWSILNPLLNMIVMSLIFSYMFKKSIQNFPLYYLTGQVFWTLFSTATNTSLTALVDNKTFLIRTKLPKQTFVLSRVYTSLVNFGYTLIAYIVILIFYKVKPSLTMLFFIPDIALLLMFSLGLSYVLSIIYAFFADIKHLYGILLTVWMYMSAIFYPTESLPPIMQKIIGYNPVYISIYIARESVIYGRIPYYTAWLKLSIYGFWGLFIGYYIFMKNSNKLMSKI